MSKEDAADRMSAEERLVAVDFGTRRVGIAMTDPLRLFAQAVGTYSPDAAVDVLLALHEAEGIERLIVGWPLTLTGEEGRATERVQQYINRLKKRLPDVPIETLDERFSSKLARRALIEAGVPRKARTQKGRVDAAAAALILQDYLDG